MRQSIKTQLSAAILTIVLITIAVISFLANYFINREFIGYVAKQQELKTQIITSSLSQQYTAFTNQWNEDYVHAIGMYSLYEGYIVKVYDKNSKVIWDAMYHDMSLCEQIMNDITSRMKVEYPQMNGEFTAKDYPLIKNGEGVGKVSISYYGPFFLNENEFKFLHSLNIILIGVGLVSLIISLFAGRTMARRISSPILRTVEAAKQIAAGKYEVRLEEGSKVKELKLLEVSVNHLAESLETLEKLRKQLTEDVAHELRTPITILQSYIEAMADGVWEATPERLQSCYDEAERIGKLVGDLERLAKIESDNLTLNKVNVDLFLLIKKTVKGFEGEIENKNLIVSIRGTNCEIMADYDRLEQVVVNLLSNAIKYSGSGKEIVFELFETGYTAGFSIRDNGIGIAKEELPYIFERFYRADKSRNRSTGGSGIGLTIVKSIVEAHGGRVSVESIKNGGSTFIVTLPKE